MAKFKLMKWMPKASVLSVIITKQIAKTRKHIGKNKFTFSHGDGQWVSKIHLMRTTGKPGQKAAGLLLLPWELKALGGHPERRGRATVVALYWLCSLGLPSLRWASMQMVSWFLYPLVPSKAIKRLKSQSTFVEIMSHHRLNILVSHVE